MNLQVFNNSEFIDITTASYEYLVIDVETTSFTKTEFRIIEIALILIKEDGQRLKAWHTLVNPECKVNFTKVHGLTDDDVKDAPKFSNIATFLAEEIAGKILVGHNISYDYGVLKSEFARIGIKMPPLARICTLQMCYDLELPLENVTLTTVRKELEIPEGLAHSALHDTAATTAVFASLLHLYKTRHVTKLRAYSGPILDNSTETEWMPAQLFEVEFFTQERQGINVESANDFPTIAKKEILEKFSRNEELARRSEETQNICPQCGRGIVVIKNKYAGGQFKGCSKFPQCRYSENLA
ncbi:MAG: exonuclease domain-containing protein [Candidatus Nanopelagicales bacterium]